MQFFRFRTFPSDLRNHHSFQMASYTDALVRNTEHNMLKGPLKVLYVGVVKASLRLAS